MTDSIRKTIEEFEQKRAKQLAELSRTERTINDLLSHIDEPPRYKEDEGRGGATASVTIKRGQFYGVPLATAVGEYLGTRARVPATTDEILTALNAGGFDFDNIGWKPETRSRSLAMSLAKNTPKFHRLPDLSWGLREWYPGVREAKRKADAAPTVDNGAETESEEKEAK